MVERTERLAQLLQDAILIAETSQHDGVLRHLRGARLSLVDVVRTSVPISIDLLSGRVFARGLPVPLSRSELALVTMLAVHTRGLHRELIAENLHPDAEPISAVNAVKVSVHRTRRRLGAIDVIRYHEGRYTLGERVDVELPRLEGELRGLRVEASLTSEQRDRFEQVRQRVLDGRPAFMLEWPWFDDTEQRLRNLGRELCTSLARDAVHAENYQRALDLAAELVRDDPLDETAAELAIRACLLAGNRAAAILEYRRYASALRVELDSNPSSDLRALVSAL